MKRVEHVDDLRAILDDARASGRRVGFVPTMGYLHEGHRSLVRAARAANDVVVASIFVNPLQFAAGEDLDRYPRDLDRDARILEAEHTDLLFTPPVEEMYPGGAPLTTVSLPALSRGLCGGARPTHFDGVATVVTKLFSIVGPSRAYFGKKDFQQYVIVRRLAADLSFPVEVVGCPLVREPDGLAMSSRNAYLSPAQRQAATVLWRGLSAGAAAVEAGERDAATLRRVVANTITVEPTARLEYVEVVSTADLAPVDRLDGEVLVAVAARLGETRLIDNISVVVDGGEVTCDLGVIAESPGER
ncbi:MAG TPA: pantoate--beta-alanine ligase [Acidimicrobiia bacterium]|nr:pantoate--beta-alanine ligase [Acidimicrobiia bacterium]